jgi:hypothetical protein
LEPAWWHCHAHCQVSSWLGGWWGDFTSDACHWSIRTYQLYLPHG